MPRKTLFLSVAAFVLAGLLAFAGALVLASLVERRTGQTLSAAFADAGIGWVEVSLDGFVVGLSGTAPSESARIRAIQVAGRVVDMSRLDEDIRVPVRGASVAPVFRLEVMRNRNELSLIGLVPASGAGAPVVERLREALPALRIEDLVQSAEHPVPAGWVPAVDFAVGALQRFTVGRISVTAGRIEVEALVDGPAERRALDEALRGMAPRGLVLALDLVAPRPVAAPFLMRVDAEEGALHLASCVADTAEAQAQIGAALGAAGVTRRLNCPLALGSPSPRWGEAAAAAIAALADLRDGTLTLSDGAVLLTVAHSVDPADFDRAVGRLETALPEAFRLNATRLDPPVEDSEQTAALPEVRLSLTEAGRMSLSGRLPDERMRTTIRTFAAARFGTGSVDIAARLDPDLPAGWPLKVMTAIEALAELHHGEASVRPDRVRITGVSGNPDARAQVTQVLLDGLGAGATIEVAVRYDAALDPVANAPTPDNCEAQVQAILRETKITFNPGSSEIDSRSGAVVDRIADVLRDCGELPFEVAGYTDSQGRAETNLNLSQARAEAVINALLMRRVLVSSLVARGYGAADPIADNATESGREANRRIEFRLIRPAAEPEPLDPALEAGLTFDVRSPGANTTRPRPRPGSEPPEAPGDEGSGD